LAALVAKHPFFLIRGGEYSEVAGGQQAGREWLTGAASAPVGMARS
jgi:hypothetical protein